MMEYRILNINYRILNRHSRKSFRLKPYSPEEETFTGWVRSISAQASRLHQSLKKIFETSALSAPFAVAKIFTTKHQKS
jgi:hypothetical protein